MTIKTIDTENVTPEMIEAFRHAPYIDYIDSGIRAALEAAPVVKDSLTTDHSAPNLGMVNKIMEQAQMFASSWSLADTQKDDGNAYFVAAKAREKLRAMVTAFAATAEKSPAVDHTPAVPEQFTRAEIDLFRQWYNNIYDVNNQYLEAADDALYVKLSSMLSTEPDHIPDAGEMVGAE